MFVSANVAAHLWLQMIWILVLLISSVFNRRLLEDSIFGMFSYVFSLIVLPQPL